MIAIQFNYLRTSTNQVGTNLIWSPHEELLSSHLTGTIILREVEILLHYIEAVTPVNFITQDRCNEYNTLPVQI